MNKVKKKLTFWGNYKMPGTTPVEWRVGALELWIRTHADELWIYYQHDDARAAGIKAPSPAQAPQESAAPGNAPEISADVNWRRWTLQKSYEKLRILPVFPDLPVVVKPEYPFRITPQVKTRIYVRVPLWARIQLGETIITEIPTVILSKTWFGSFTDGELCYWISSAARKAITADIARPYMAISPINIMNRSSDELLVEKICHRVKELPLFESNGQLWSSETTAKYRGVNEGSEIEVSTKAPSDAAKSQRFMPPREKSNKSFTAKTFSTLKELPGFDLFQR